MLPNYIDIIMTYIEELLIDGCKIYDLSKEEAAAVLQILLTQEQVIDMLKWMQQNIHCNHDPIDVIIAACEIQTDHKFKKS